MQASDLVKGERDHDGHGPNSTPIRDGRQMCSIDAESRHLLQPFRPADAGIGLDLDGVPVQAEMAGQRRHGGVVMGERVGRPLHRPNQRAPDAQIRRPGWFPGERSARQIAHKNRRRRQRNKSFTPRVAPALPVQVDVNSGCMVGLS